jgi:hypothetical protein
VIPNPIKYVDGSEKTPCQLIDARSKRRTSRSNPRGIKVKRTVKVAHFQIPRGRWLEVAEGVVRVSMLVEEIRHHLP